MPLINSLREECLYFFKLFSFSNSDFSHWRRRSSSIISIQLGLLFIIILALFAIRTYPIGNNRSEYAKLSYKADNHASILNVRTNIFSPGFI